MAAGLDQLDDDGPTDAEEDDPPAELRRLVDEGVEETREDGGTVGGSTGCLRPWMRLEHYASGHVHVQAFGGVVAAAAWTGLPRCGGVGLSGAAHREV